MCDKYLFPFLFRHLPTRLFPHHNVFWGIREYRCLYLESFESAANKIRNNETTRLVDFESEDDEEIEGDFDEECSETEQDEDEEISETESDPAEDFQITLF